MKETYLAVAGRIRREVEEVESVVERAQSIWEEVDPGTDPGGYRVDAVALNLHGFYAGLERIFETIARRVDQTVPEGAHWHQEVLDPMNTELSDVRPAVLSDESRNQLKRYRGSRNVYAFEFEPDQIDLLMKRLPDTTERVTNDLRSFATFLDEAAQT